MLGTEYPGCLVRALSDGFGWDPGEAASVPVASWCRAAGSAAQLSSGNRQQVWWLPISQVSCGVSKMAFASAGG